MKRSLVLFFAILALMLVFSGCKKEANISFSAIVTDVSDDAIAVTTTDDVGFKEASVSLADTKYDFKPEVGQTLNITILPAIKETSPVQVVAVSIEFVAAPKELTGKALTDQCESEIAGVSMSINEGSVTTTGLTAVILDTNGEFSYIYGESFELQKLEGNSWKKVPVVIDGSFDFNEGGLITDDTGTLTLEIDWEWLYGSLGPGTYKFVKDIYFSDGSKFFSAAFKLS